MVLFDECESTCISAPIDVTALLTGVGSTMSALGEAGAAAGADVAVVPYSPYTDGVVSLFMSATGSIDVGAGGTGLAFVEDDPARAPSGTTVVIAVEEVGAGAVLLMADTDIFAGSLAEEDNGILLGNLP